MYTKYLPYNVRNNYCLKHFSINRLVFLIIDLKVTVKLETNPLNQANFPSYRLAQKVFGFVIVVQSKRDGTAIFRHVSRR